MSHATCPACGGRVRTVRFGIRLSPLKSRIVDAVAAAGRTGLARDELARVAGSDATTAAVHIYQINQALRETAHRIRTERGRFTLVTLGA
jgi:hypothetical protein